MHRFIRFFVSSSLLLAVLCAQSAHAIIGGDPNGTPPDSSMLRVDPNLSDSPWSGVGSITVGDKSYTATLIDASHVLTAAHVVGNSGAGNITFSLNANGDFSQRIAASAVHVNPGYSGFTPGPDGLVRNDLAIVELSEPVASGVSTYPIYPSALTNGTVLTLVGYGGPGDGINGDAPGGNTHTKRIGANAADLLIPGSSGNAEVFMFDFDGPNLSSNPLGGGTLGNTVEATYGPGDSGSPAFISDGGRWYLAGVGTFVNQFRGGSAQSGLFGSGGGGMLLSYYSGWITQTVSMVPEPAPLTLWMPSLVLLGLMASLRRRQ